MKRFVSLSILFIAFCLMLAGCASKRNPYPNSQLAQETWANAIDQAPGRWTNGADRWFMTGDANSTEVANRHAPYSAAISTMMVKVPDFNSIQVNGDFQVQIFGTYDNNSVYVYGPNAGVRSLSVQVRKNVLCVTQESNASRGVMNKVIIRIGVNYLRSLTQLGCGTVEGVRLHSNGLMVNSSGQGNMYLAGNLALRRVESTGSGMVTIFGVNARGLEIRSLGSGDINLGGQVGIKSILHRGSGDVNVIGANSDSDCAMKIYTDGSGKIGLSGQANIAEIIAKGHTCVYACPTMSSNTYVYEYDNARVGLSGSGRNLYVDTNNGSRFYGRSLCVESAFVRARDNSHVNVESNSRIFAAATQNASVYFYGEPKIMSQFVSGNGVVIPIWPTGYRSCGMIVQPRVSYKGEG